MNFCKIALKVLVVLLIFSMGFTLSELRYTARHQIDDSQLSGPACDQIDDFHQFVYLYDTEQKLEDYYRMRGWISLDELRLHPESPEARMMIDYLDKLGLHLESPEARALKPTSRLKAAGSLRRLKARLWVKGLTILRDPNKM